MSLWYSWLMVLGSVAAVWCCGVLFMKATEVLAVKRPQSEKR